MNSMSLAAHGGMRHFWVEGLLAVALTLSVVTAAYATTLITPRAPPPPAYAKAIVEVPPPPPPPPAHVLPSKPNHNYRQEPGERG